MQFFYFVFNFLTYYSYSDKKEGKEMGYMRNGTITAGPCKQLSVAVKLAYSADKEN